MQIVFINARTVAGILLYADVIFTESNVLKRVGSSVYFEGSLLQDMGAREVGPKLELQPRPGARQALYRMEIYQSDENVNLIRHFEKIEDILTCQMKQING